LEHPEAFSLLLGLKYKGETKKTELINMMMLEYTTGIEWINKLIKEGYIIERSDVNDRRSKLLHISSKGEKLYEKAYKKTIESARLVFEGVPDEDIKLVLQLLIPIEEKHHRLHAELKNKNFEEIKKVLSTKN
jgi:DNA-binding MarR family transcriptional regulator